MDEEKMARGAAQYFGFSEEEGLAARNLLSPWPQGFNVRFSELCRFARDYGVSLPALAQFISEATQGIEPWDRGKDPLSPDEHKRVREAIASRSRGGDWAGAILSLLDEVDALRGHLKEKPSSS
jgi:hypothetical protein